MFNFNLFNLKNVEIFKKKKKKKKWISYCIFFKADMKNCEIRHHIKIAYDKF